MKIIYVDFENVKDSGLNGVANLNSEDIVRIYYSEDANKMTFGTHRRIIESPARFEYSRMKKDLKGVKNALDVILMRDLSDRIVEEKSADFYIVSNDSDYDNYVEEKKKNKISISRIGEVCKVTQISKEPKRGKVTTHQDERKKRSRFLDHILENI